MEKKFNFVYVTTNLINGKQYVGDHSTNDLNCAYTKRYIGSGRPYLKNAIHEYGRQNFKREILEFFPTKQEAFDAQEKYIIEYNTLTPNGYNLSPKGGMNVNHSWSEESKEKLRSHRLGKKHLAESNEKNRKSHTGKNFTQEHKNNIGKARSKMKLSKETKVKISNSLKNHIVSEETKEKQRNAKLGKSLSKEHKNNIKLSRINKKRGKYERKRKL